MRADFTDTLKRRSSSLI